MTKYKGSNNANEASLYSQTTQAICIYLRSVHVCVSAIQTLKSVLWRRQRARTIAGTRPATAHKQRRRPWIVAQCFNCSPDTQRQLREQNVASGTHFSASFSADKDEALSFLCLVFTRESD